MFKLVMVLLLLMGSIKGNSMPKSLVKSKLIEAAKKRGIKGESLQSLLKTVEHESGFVPAREESHKYSYDRAKKIFSKMRNVSKEEFNKLRQDPVLFFNKVYSNREDIGTGDKEGYKARGMGLIQLTGSTKKKYAPEGYNDPSKFKDIDYDIKTTLDYYVNEILPKASSIEDVTNIVNPNLPKADKQKRFDKQVIIKKLKQEVSDKSAKKKRLEELKKQALPYAEFERKLKEENLYE